MREVFFARMLPRDIKKAVKEVPICYLPFGLLEWHSYHLPFGVDGLKIEELCRQIALKAGGVVFPTTYWGVGGEPPMPHPWSPSIDVNLFKDLLFNIFEECKKMGFKVIFALTGHFSCDQMKVVLDAAEGYMEKSKVLILGVPEFAVSMDIGYYGDHAARVETSFMLAFYPELVNMENLHEYRKKGWKPERVFQEIGIFGADPRIYASAELGHKIGDKIVKRFAEIAKKLLKRRDRKFINKLHNPIKKFAMDPKLFTETIIRYQKG